MEIPEFLEFERKKIILPIILFLLLTLVVFESTLLSAQAKNDYHEVTENALNQLKLVVYNGMLNGTDPEIKRQMLDSIFQNNISNQKTPYLLTEVTVSYVFEYTMNTFGTNFCVDSFAGNHVTDCTATELDLSLPIETIRLVGCASQFSYNISQLFPYSRYTTPDISEMRLFVYSDRGKNVFDSIEYCKYSKARDMIFNDEVNESFGVFEGFYSPASSKIHLLTPIYIFLYAILLLVVGYLISSIVLWAHKKNSILEGMGKKYYLSMIVFSLVFIIIFFVFFFNSIGSVRIFIVCSLLLSYIITTLIWKLLSSRKEDKLAKKIMQKKMRGR